MVKNLEVFWMKESLDQCRLLFLAVKTLFILDKLFKLILAWDRQPVFPTGLTFTKGQNGCKGIPLSLIAKKKADKK